MFIGCLSYTLLGTWDITALAVNKKDTIPAFIPKAIIPNKEKSCILPSSFLFFFFFKDLFIDWLIAMLGLRFSARAFSSCGKRGPLFIAVRGPLTIAASLVAEHRLQMRRLSSCGSRAQLLRGMWDLPRPGREPVSPALAGRFSTTAPPGKPSFFFFYGKMLMILFSREKKVMTPLFLMYRKKWRQISESLFLWFWEVKL